MFVSFALPASLKTIMTPRHLLALLCGLSSLGAAEPAAAKPATEPGSIIVEEDFSRPDAVKPWRWGAGKWTVENGSLTGTETTERKHPAGIACQRSYHDAAIRFRFQFAGGTTAMLLLRDQFGNLCRVTIKADRMTITKDRPNLPADNKEKTVVLDKAELRLKPGEWYAVSAQVKGSEFTASLEGQASLKGRHAGIDVDKTEIEFLAGGASVLFDDLKAVVPGAR